MSVPALHVVHETGAIDLAVAEDAARTFLTALGVSLDSEHLQATPGRMARAYAELRATTNWCWPAASRCARSANTICCRSR